MRSIRFALRQASFISRRIALLLIIGIIVSGLLVGLSGMNSARSTNHGESPSPFFTSNDGSIQGLPASSNQPIGNDTLLVESTSTSEAATVVTTVQPGTTLVQPNLQLAQSTATTQSQQNNSGFVEFFSNLTLLVSSPDSALDQASAVAYSLGGYLAFSSLDNYSAIAVLRIPASSYAEALSKVESIGNLTRLQSSSNDVRVQYTDLNATLQSMFAEQASLLRLVNQSTMLNETLLIENQLQQIDAQINSIESQILQTRLLIDYSTITVTFDKAQLSSPLKLKLTATPQNGESPLGVTLTAVVTGGAPPYIVNYNLGDGSSYTGRSLIHTFVGAGTYNVTATVTDSSGNAKEEWILISVVSQPTRPAFESFLAFVGGLFVGVVEGIIEVAVIVLPIALVITLVVFPFRNRMRGKKSANSE